MSLPSYPEYKDSGVAWLGEVPAHWEVAPLKRAILSIESGVSVNAIDTPAEDDRPGVLKTSCVYHGQFDATENKAVVPEEFARVACPVTAGTLIVSRMNTPDLVGAAGLVRQSVENLFLPDRLWQVHFSHAEAAYVHYWSRTPNYRAQVESVCAGTSSSMQNLSQDAFRNFVLTLPSLTEQTAIATFLDRETAKIDGLIAEQEKLIALLAEKRQATISQAVTKGLNPDAQMKESGAEWLGKVPTGWNCLPVKRLFRLVAEPAPDGNDEELLSIYTDIGVRPRKSLEAKGNKATTTDGYWRVKKGDIIVNKLLAWMGAIGLSDYDGVTSPAYDILRGVKPLHPKFFDYLFRCGIMFTEFRRHSRGIMDMRLRLYFEELGQIIVPFPPLDAQRQIIEFLDQEAARADALSAAATHSIDLLRERRSAMISAAVTGKIDVRHLAEAEAA